MRLCKVLPEITVAQLGARKGCQVLDGITTVQMMLSLSRAKKASPLAAKLDIAAAFDSVHHRSKRSASTVGDGAREHGSLAARWRALASRVTTRSHARHEL